jgi:protein phosphatase
MLVCPHCQFENPDQNRFCQKCGTSLTERPCPACDSMVPLSIQQCPQCGTATATRWQALVLPAAQKKPEAATVPPLATSPAEGETVGRSVPDPQFLDANSRYQLTEALPTAITTTGVTVCVIDCQPLAPSMLNLGHQPPDGTRVQEGDSADPEVPAIAHTYLELQQELFSAIPELHDAWEQDGHVVLLLEDRSSFMSLTDLWADKSIPPFQLLHLLHQITVLWTSLEAHQSIRSLLELDNLTVDEDQLLCLQRLYADDPENPPSLMELGLIWKSLFQGAPRPELAAIPQVIEELGLGKIGSIAEVQSRLEAIAETLQPVQADLPSPSPAGGDQWDASASGEPAASSLLGAGSPPVVDLSKIPAIDEEDAGVEADDSPTIVLPMKLVSIEDAGCSDVGRKRDHNEDCFSIQSTVKKSEGLAGRILQVRGLYILCDGMGGHAGGEVASALAVETLQHYFQEHWKDQLPSEALIRQGILEANQAIYDLNQADDRSGSGRMGTTLVMVMVQDTQAVASHIGDSRLYRFSRRRGLEQMTTDHEVGQREIQRGVEPAIAYARPDAYQLTQALGPRDETFVSPEIQFIDLNEDMLLLLCSDGLTDHQLLETQWKTHVEPLLSSDTNLEQGTNHLIELANQYNGHDNITAIAIRIKVRPNLEQLRRGL